MKVIITEEAEKSLDEIIAYLEKHWGKSIVIKFKQNIRKTINRIKKYPNSFPKSRFIEIRRALISKKVMLFYKVEDNNLVIFLFWDARQDPEALKK